MTVSLSKKYQFSSAHRLNSDYLDAAANIEVYDKCNNLKGHGHDYTLWVTITGVPDNKTGMILPIEELDKIVESVLDLLDYKHLDKEVGFFLNQISTSENIIQFIWKKLSGKFDKTELLHLKLWETNNNYFELGREL